jgi:hypothetical protein
VGAAVQVQMREGDRGRDMQLYGAKTLSGSRYQVWRPILES